MNSKPLEFDGRYPLRGIRVLDFTWVHAGPSATRILADQGAQIIKIESGFALELTGGPNPRTARGVGMRQNWNSGKLSLSLNMKTPQAIAIAKRLVAVSDVVSENFSGRVMPRWGMDYESLREIKPDIIMLSMSGLGRTGPWKDNVSYGQTLQALSGFTWLTGFPDTDPCGPASAYSDAVAGITGAQALLLALIHRARTGQGQQIDLSQFEAVSALLETLVLDLSVNRLTDGKNPPPLSNQPSITEKRSADGGTKAVQRTGNRLPHGGGAPHGAYRCMGEERWAAIAVFTNSEWEALTQAIGGPQWALDERFSTVLGRQKHADDLDRLVESWTTQHTTEDVMHRLQAVGVAAGVVQTGADLADNDPQLKERGFFRYVTDVEGTLRTIEGPPYKLSRTPGGPVQGAPGFGAHQTYLLGELLCMSDEELAECAVEGAFE